MRLLSTRAQMKTEVDDDDGWLLNVQHQSDMHILDENMSLQSYSFFNNCFNDYVMTN